MIRRYGLLMDNRWIEGVLRNEEECMQIGKIDSSRLGLEGETPEGRL